MKHLNIEIPGIQGRIERDTLIVSSKEPLDVVSTSVLNGGFSSARFIINQHVKKNFSHDNPEKYLQNTAEKLGLNGHVVGMMTAADLENLSIANLSKGGLNITAVVTGGISNALTVGETISNPTKNIGTINTILLIDANLRSSARVGAIITATEAKCHALKKLNVKSTSGKETATGTTTDAVVVACTGREPNLKYSGTGTRVGSLIGRAVSKATVEAVSLQEGWAL